MDDSTSLPKRILVLGARGFLGEHVVRQLTEAGCDVLAAVRSGNDWGLSSPRLSVVEGDLLSVSVIRRALDQVQAVVFTAGRTWQPDLDVDEYHRQNSGLTESFLEALGQRPGMRVVFTSSMSTLTGTRQPLSTSEDSPRNLICERLLNPYTRAKIHCERLALAAVARGNDIIILNPGQLFGPGAHSHSNLHSTWMLLSLCQSKNPFYIPGGTTISDVRDVAQAHVAALTRGRRGERYILGGHCVARKEFYEQCVRLTGVKMPRGIPLALVYPLLAMMDGFAYVSGGRLRGPAHRSFVRAEKLYNYGSSAKAQQELGFIVRPLEQTIFDTLRDFYRRGLLPPELHFINVTSLETAAGLALLRTLAQETAYSRFLLRRLMQVYQICQSNTELRATLNRMLDAKRVGSQIAGAHDRNLWMEDRRRLLGFLEYLYFASDEFLNWVR